MMTIAKKRYLICLVLAVIMLCSSVSWAKGEIDLSRDVGLTLTYTDGQKALNGAKFNLYFVAAVDEVGELAVTEDFRDFRVDIRGKNDEAWKKLAATLESYVALAKIVPTDSGRTDQAGQLTFPTAEIRLQAGLYLVTGERFSQGNYRYDAQAFIVMLPAKDTAENAWKYHITANVKHESHHTPDNPPGESYFIDVNVIKIWQDSAADSARPQEVSVHLLRDGEIYATVSLNKKNNWRYKWQSLAENHVWRVAEEVPAGYTVTISREGNTYTITNTVSLIPPNLPAPPQDTENPLSPDNVEKPPSVPTEAVTAEPVLPRTGILWWPVIVLLGSGVGFMLIGFILKKSRS